jgi:hypothetical protein
MQQQTSTFNQQDSSDEAHSVPQQESPQRAPDGDGGWGLGSASALDTLRRRNYRGRPNQHGEDKPTSH